MHGQTTSNWFAERLKNLLAYFTGDLVIIMKAQIISFIEFSSAFSHMLTNEVLSGSLQFRAGR